MGRGSSSNNSPTPTPFYNQVQFATNIPASGQYYGLDFTRWIVKIQGSAANIGNNANNTIANGFASQTFEILEDDASSGVHLFTLSNNLTNPTLDPRNPANNPPPVPSDWASFLYVDPNYINPTNGVTGTNANGGYTFTKAASSLAPEWANGVTFTLDGRNMRAFNGPGLTQVFGSPAVNNAAITCLRLTSPRWPISGSTASTPTPRGWTRITTPATWRTGSSPSRAPTARS